MSKANNKDASGVFIVNFEHSSHHVLVYLLSTWNNQLPAELFLSSKLCFVRGERQMIDLI